MKIVIAPDSYKGSLTASEVATVIQQGFHAIFPNAEYIKAPMADGGEGTLDCFLMGSKAELHSATIHDPLGNKIKTSFGILSENTTALIEMAKASGISLVPLEQRDPLQTSTLGTGELILKALKKGCRRFIIGLGGSATCDGGMGALHALGIRFKNNQGDDLKPCGASLEQIDSIVLTHLDPRLSDCDFILAHDVNSPFLGLEGALMYAPQKGATPEQVEILHKAFEHYAWVLSKYTEKDIRNTPGTGAAGGLAAGLYAFLNATLKPGAEVVCEAIHLHEKMQNANLVITGEGQMDGQTVKGKTPIAVARMAKELDIPVIAIAAKLGKGYGDVYEQGIDAVFSIVSGPLPQSICMLYTKPLLITTANNIARLLSLKILKE